MLNRANAVALAEQADEQSKAPRCPMCRATFRLERVTRAVPFVIESLDAIVVKCVASPACEWTPRSGPSALVPQDQGRVPRSGMRNSRRAQPIGGPRARLRQGRRRAHRMRVAPLHLHGHVRSSLRASGALRLPRQESYPVLHGLRSWLLRPVITLSMPCTSLARCARPSGFDTESAWSAVALLAFD